MIELKFIPSPLFLAESKALWLWRLLVASSARAEGDYLWRYRRLLLVVKGNALQLFAVIVFDQPGLKEAHYSLSIAQCLHQHICITMLTMSGLKCETFYCLV